MKLHEVFAETLKRTRIIAILRGVTPFEILDLCKLLEDGGLSLIEVPLNSPEALRSIELAANYAKAGSLLIGAGTVRSVADVELAAAAGAGYIISPSVSPEIIQASRERGLLSIPGVFTATEACLAEDCGSDYLKLFPAGAQGAAYCRDLMAVLKKPLIAVGGIGLGNINELLAVCAAVGLGSALYQRGKNWREIERDLQAIQTELKNGGETEQNWVGKYTKAHKVF